MFKLISIFKNRHLYKCQGPCFPHCETKSKYIWISLGMIIGIIIGWFIKNKNKNKLN
jgi:membrane-associated PAP2 superfamily phosphatase